MSGNPEHRSFKAASFVTDCIRLPFCLSLRAMKSGRVRPPVLPKQSLAGIRILVGRARHQASALSAGLRKLGADVIEIPFIEIHKPSSYQPLDSALNRLHEYDWLILTSVNGVEAVWERVRKLGVRVDVAEAYETVLPDSSRSRLHAVLGNPRHRPDVVMFTSSSTVTNFSALLAKRRGRAHLGHIALLHEIRFASIGPVTSSRLRELGLPVHIEAKEYTIIGLIQAIVDHFHTSPQQSQVT